MEIINKYHFRVGDNTRACTQCFMLCSVYEFRKQLFTCDKCVDKGFSSLCVGCGERPVYHKTGVYCEKCVPHSKCLACDHSPCGDKLYCCDASPRLCRSCLQYTDNFSTSTTLCRTCMVTSRRTNKKPNLTPCVCCKQTDVQFYTDVFYRSSYMCKECVPNLYRPVCKMVPYIGVDTSMLGYMMGVAGVTRYSALGGMIQEKYDLGRRLRNHKCVLSVGCKSDRFLFRTPFCIPCVQQRLENPGMDNMIPFENLKFTYSTSMVFLEYINHEMHSFYPPKNKEYHRVIGHHPYGIFHGCGPMAQNLEFCRFEYWVEFYSEICSISGVRDDQMYVSCDINAWKKQLTAKTIRMVSRLCMSPFFTRDLYLTMYETTGDIVPINRPPGNFGHANGERRWVPYINMSHMMLIGGKVVENQFTWNLLSQDHRCPLCGNYFEYVDHATMFSPRLHFVKPGVHELHNMFFVCHLHADVQYWIDVILGKVSHPHSEQIKKRSSPYLQKLYLYDHLTTSDQWWING